MKKADLIVIICVVLVFLPFFVSEPVYKAYTSFNAAHGMIMSFIKFALLSTLGEAIGLRIKKGVYNEKGFGLLPRAIVWGFLGMAIKAAFIIFSKGTPYLLVDLGYENAISDFTADGFTWGKVLVAFSISTAMNLIFAPVFMTLHKITDTHILQNKGTLRGFFRPIPYYNIFPSLNWKVQWGFVFKKTIPFFWIPAHTITFLLPPEWRILFAAILGVVLGVILAVANIMGKE